MTTVPMHLLEDLNTHLLLQSAQNTALIPVCIEVFPFFPPYFRYDLRRISFPLVAVFDDIQFTFAKKMKII